MQKIIFTISYEIKPEKRDEYVALSRQMKDHVGNSLGKNYSVYEHKGKKNSFTEVYLLDSMDEYEQLEEQDDLMTSLLAQLEPLLTNGKMKYSTLVELS